MNKETFYFYTSVAFCDYFRKGFKTCLAVNNGNIIKILTDSIKTFPIYTRIDSICQNNAANLQIDNLP